MLDKQNNILKVGNTTLKGVVKWKDRLPYYECIAKVRELRKEDKSVNFPSNIQMDELLAYLWDSFDDETKNFFTSFTPTPCKEWIVYGPKNKSVDWSTVQYSNYDDNGWTAVVDGIPKEAIDAYNEIVKCGKNAALFIKEYNDGECIPVVDEGKKRVVITPSRKGIMVMNKFSRDHGAEGMVDYDLRVARSFQFRPIDLLQNDRRIQARRNYTVPEDQSYAGPLTRCDGTLDLMFFNDGQCVDMFFGPSRVYGTIVTQSP